MGIKELATYRIEQDGFSIEMSAPADLTSAELKALVAEAVGTAVDVAVDAGRDGNIGNAREVKARFAAHVLAGKTPAQIYTFLQDRINGWTKLSDAKSDLADLLPLLAAGLAWMVMERDS